MQLSERVYLRLTNAAPGALAARLDLLRPSYFAAPPLNGQRERQAIVRELLQAIDFDYVVETGTYRAATTLFLSYVSGKPVHTVELLTRYHAFATARCSGHPEIRISKGDSRDFLRGLAKTLGSGSVFFYLDAHWEDDVPRAQELEIIAASWDRAVVVIDDFAVADDPEYGYVTYGDTPLTLDYLPPMPGWKAFYPVARAATETGARRGCVVLTSPGIGRSVEALNLIRPAG